MPPSAGVRLRLILGDGADGHRFVLGPPGARPYHDDLFARLLEIELETGLLFEHLPARGAVAELRELGVLGLQLRRLLLQSVDLPLHVAVAQHFAREPPADDREDHQVGEKHPFEADEPSKSSRLWFLRRHTSVGPGVYQKAGQPSSSFTSRLSHSRSFSSIMACSTPFSPEAMAAWSATMNARASLSFSSAAVSSSRAIFSLRAPPLALSLWRCIDSVMRWWSSFGSSTFCSSRLVELPAVWSSTVPNLRSVPSIPLME